MLQRYRDIGIRKSEYMWKRLNSIVNNFRHEALFAETRNYTCRNEKFGTHNCRNEKLETHNCRNEKAGTHNCRNEKLGTHNCRNDKNKTHICPNEKKEHIFTETREIKNTLNFRNVKT